MGKAIKTEAHIFDSGSAITPKTRATVPVLPDGQLAPVTDQPGVNLMVRKGGSLVPPMTQEYNRTDGYIYMRVSPTGTSPADGTVVHNQDEYDALGANLRYINDVFRILPDILMAPIVVTLADGVHTEDTTRPPPSGFSQLTIRVPQRLRFGLGPFWYGDDFTNLRYTAAINIEGENRTTIEASQAGTLGGTGNFVLTRSSGSWTPNEHRGRLVLFDSGVNAGSIAPIISNTATELILSTHIYSAGSCNFTIFEPSASIVCTDAGGKYVYAPATGDGIVGVTLYNVKVGTPTYPCEYFAWNGNAYNYAIYSMFELGGYTAIYVSGGEVIGSRIDSSSIHCTGESAIAVVDNAYLFTWGLAVWGSPTGTYPLIRVTGGSKLYAVDGAFHNTSGNSNQAVLQLSSGASLDSDYGIRLIGTGVESGLQVLGEAHMWYEYARAAYVRMTFENVGVAVDVDGGKLNGSVVAYPVSPTGVGTGWRLKNGAQVASLNPSQVGGTTNITIDGESKTYATDLANAGDVINGRYGSRFVRRES